MYANSFDCQQNKEVPIWYTQGASRCFVFDGYEIFQVSDSQNQSAVNALYLNVHSHLHLSAWGNLYCILFSLRSQFAMQIYEKQL